MCRKGKEGGALEYDPCQTVPSVCVGVCSCGRTTFGLVRIVLAVVSTITHPVTGDTAVVVALKLVGLAELVYQGERENIRHP